MKNTQIKSVILIAAIWIVSFKTMAQSSNMPPQAITSAFTAKYPQATIKKWKMGHDGSYAAQFTMNNKKYFAYYGQDGNWMKTEREMHGIRNLPMNAKSFLKTGKYASWHIDDVKKAQMPDGQTMYMVEIDNNSGNPVSYTNDGAVSNKILSFDNSGKLIDAKDNNNWKAMK